MNAMPLSSPTAALMQPTFLPWVGYFALIRAADVFVFLDDFQFVRRSFHQRNRIFVARGKFDWVTVPVDHKGQQDVSLVEVTPRLDEVRGKLVGMLRHAYAQAPFLKPLLPEIEAWIRAPHATLADLNIGFIEMAARWLGIETRFVRSSTLGASGVRSSRIADVLRRVGAKTYLSARGAADYMIADGVFPLADVQTVFQSYTPAPYAQVQSPAFVPYLSVLDVVLQVGPTEARTVLAAGEGPFTSWDDMVRSFGTAPSAAMPIAVR